MIEARGHAAPSDEQARLRRTVLDAAPAEIGLFDPHGRFLYVTPSAIRDDAVRRWVVGRTHHDWCRARGHPTSVADQRQEAIEQVVRDGRSVTLDEVRRGPLGGRRRYVATFAPVTDADGRVVNVVSVAMEAADPGTAEASVRSTAAELRRELQRRRESESSLRAELDDSRRRHEARRALDVHAGKAASGEDTPDAPGGLLASVRDAVEAVAATDAPVLVVAEMGVPTGAVARAVHNGSARRIGPFVRVDCALGPADALDDVLFGPGPLILDTPGSGSGGLGLAEGGTLFLDHVAALPLGAQDRLLAVLGGAGATEAGEESPPDLRVVAATTADLAAACEAGRFRPDLLYRLNTLPLQLPPLRHRSADVERLSRAFLAESARRLCRTLRSLTPAEIERLQSYGWPGNDAELRCVMNRAAILAQGERPLVQLPEASQVARAPGPAPRDFLTEAEMRNRERSNLIGVLDRAGWKVYGADGAAALLGVRPTTLASRIKKLGLKRGI